jgi:mRNA interferase RelE/StbE
MQMRSKEKAASSSNYRIFETVEFQKSLDKLAVLDRNFISGKAATYIYPQLRLEPHYGANVRKLAAFQPETWRYRLGRFRIFFRVDEIEKIVFILTVDYQKDTYK